MLRKRLIGTVTICDGWVVQSLGYKQYLPIGKPTCVIENLDRWGIDEILIQVIDRSSNSLGPDFELLDSISKMGVSTPIVYTGGISTVSEAVGVIRAGADRIGIDTLLQDRPEEVKAISKKLGAQAIIATMPIAFRDGDLKWIDYRNGTVAKQNIKEVLKMTETRVISELVLIDYKNDGRKNGFDFNLLSAFPKTDASLILFGGISELEQMNKALLINNVSAVAVGNFLNYKEHAVQKYKKNLMENCIRPPIYSDYVSVKYL